MGQGEQGSSIAQNRQRRIDPLTCYHLLRRGDCKQLIDLHFNPMAGTGVTAGTSNSAASTSITPSTPPSAGKSGARPRLTPQISERFSALTNTLDQVTPRDVWRGFRSVTGVGLEQVELEKKRELERGLVVWEEDGEVRRCRICQ